MNMFRGPIIGINEWIESKEVDSDSDSSSKKLSFKSIINKLRQCFMYKNNSKEAEILREL
jgi:hypothetical protein